MSSKLHRGGSAGAQEIAWHNVSGSVPSPTAYPGPLQASHPPPGGAVHELENRLLTLERETEQRSQEAFAKGLHEGDTAVRQQFGAEVNSTVGRLARSIEEISGLRQRFRHEAEAEVVKLAIAIARRVLHRELTVDSEALLGIVKAALTKMDSRELHQIRIHPDHAAALQNNLHQLGLPTRVEVIADPGLEPGAVILDTARGALDASVQTQLSEIERGFADLVRYTA
ncbi:MAG: FliH/SctL family protein [Acidobacteriota bacterium]|nr:FliH/SctL family protein [Acidobacteriota bacterium]